MNKYERQISEIFFHFLDKNSKVILFGSRATGNYHRTSDYDFALKTDSKISVQKMRQIKEAFYESTIPYKIDVVDINNVSELLYSEILKTGIEWKLQN